MNLNEKDAKDIADNRVYGAKGLGLLYRLFSGIVTVTSLAGVLYFVLINEYSPFENIKSTIPLTIQHLPSWIYYLIAALICISAFANTFLSRILDHRSKIIFDEWKKSGKLPERKKPQKKAI